MGGHRVLGQALGQVSHTVGNRGRVKTTRLQAGVQAGGHNPPGESPGAGLGEDTGVGVAPQQNGVVSIKACSKSVIGRHRRPLKFVTLHPDTRFHQGRKMGADTGGQLPCRFFGEGEPQDFGGGDVGISNQPQHSLRHRFCFSRACARDDAEGAPRVALDNPLLLSGRGARPHNAGQIASAIPHRSPAQWRANGAWRVSRVGQKHGARRRIRVGT